MVGPKVQTLVLEDFLGSAKANLGVSTHDTTSSLPAPRQQYDTLAVPAIALHTVVLHIAPTAAAAAAIVRYKCVSSRADLLKSAPCISICTCCGSIVDAEDSTSDLIKCT